MNILAIDTSQKSVSVAILEDDAVRADLFINSGLHHSEILLPVIEQACRMAGLTVDGMDLFALTIGPGAFTGLRIGATTIKGLVLATGKPVVGVSTLDALAFNLVHTQRRVCPMLDAQKNQIYTALYRPASDGLLERIIAEQVIDVDLWMAGIHDPALFLGDGAVKYRERIHAHYADSAAVAAADLNHVKASSVALLARDRFHRGEQLNLLTFTPQYLRPSEAEVRGNQETSQIDKAS
jgi:tRNA threonylcarbamoyladenosine biosynthesis protein TsaB